MSRFFRFGPGGVLRRLLDAREGLPTDYLDQVQPSAEVRALRPWEDFDERIHRWWIAVSVAAVAGEFSGVVFAPGSAMQRGSIWTVDGLDVSTPNANPPGATVTVGATPAGFAAGPVKYADNRWGPVAAGVGPPLDVSFGTDPATTGSGCWFLEPPLSRCAVASWPGWVSTEVGQNLAVWGNTVLQLLRVSAWGRIIVP